MKANEKRALACTTCAKAKSRCITGPPGSDKCERCHRLNKTCLSRTPAPPRPKNHVKRSRVAELEKRLSELEGGGIHAVLNGASSTCGSVRTGTSSSSAGEGEIVEKPTAPSPPGRTRVPSDYLFDHLFPSEQDTSSSSWPSKETVASSRLRHAWNSLWPLPDEAETMLVMYHEKVERLFPFVIVPEMKAAELKEKRPFLWKAVMMVACFLDGARHDRLGEELLAVIGKAAVVDGDKSLDLLQALQLLVAWFHHALRSSRLSNLLFLARSLCLNLGLGGNQPLSADMTGDNLDALRAYAGTYYLNTLVFTTNKRTEILMNTNLLEKCCNILETANQYKSDGHLVKLVRIQQIAQSISLTLALEPDQQTMQLPMTIVVQSFQDQINALRQSLSPEHEENYMLQSHISIAEVMLTEWAISDRYCNASNMALTDRLRVLWSCVRSLKNVFFMRMGIWDDFDDPRFLCLHASDLSYALLIGVRLVTLRLPGWNLEQIERELSFGQVMDSLVAHLTGLVERRTNGVVSSALKEGGALPADDHLSGLTKLCAGLRLRVKAEMAGAMAAFKEEPGLEAAQATTAMQGLMGDMGGQYWGDVMIDAFWNGPGDFGDFELQ